MHAFRKQLRTLAVSYRGLGFRGVAVESAHPLVAGFALKLVAILCRESCLSAPSL